MCKQRLTNKDVKKKGFPKELIYDGIRTNVWHAPKRKKPTDDHWTAYLNDKNIKKHSWIEINKERTFQKAEPLVKQAAVDYYTSNYHPKTKTYQKTKEKKLTPFIVSDILTFYQDAYDRKKRQQAKDKEKLQSAVNRNITTKGSNLNKCGDFFGTMDLRNIEEQHFYQFIDKRGVGKSTIGNNLSTFSTALKFKLDRLAGDITTSRRTKKALKEELKRILTIIRYFRSENKLTVKDALKRAKAPKLNGHGRISYEQFKNIIKWMRENPEIEDGYTDFFQFLYWHSSRFSEASLLIGKNIIVDGVGNIKLHIPSIITKDMQGGTYSLFPTIEEILKRRLQENIQPDEPIFNITNTKNNKKQKMTRGYYDKMWRAIKVKFDLRLPNGKYQTPHILRASCVNNLLEAALINVHNQTRQSDEIIKHYTEAETINGIEVAQLKAWRDDLEEKLKEKADKEIGKKGVEVFFNK